MNSKNESVKSVKVDNRLTGTSLPVALDQIAHLFPLVEWDVVHHQDCIHDALLSEH